MDRWTLIAVLFCGIISYLYGQTGCQDSPSANCSSYNSDMICDSQGVFYLWARDNCPLHCGFCQRLSTRSTVLTSTDPGEKTLKPKSIPGTKTLSKGTEGLSTRSTVLISTDPGEKTLKPKSIPGTKTLSKGTENIICDTAYNHWAKENCPLHCGFCQDPYFKRYSNKGCRPDISLSFRGGVRDISFNRAAVYYTGVDVYNDTAFFKGSNRLLIWRYRYYDYRDKLQISFKFKPVPGPRLELYTLVSNCEGVDEPSYGIVLNTTVNIITIFLKTNEIKDQRIMTFDINPTTWTDVYFRYQNGTMIGRVNNIIKKRPLIGNIQIRPYAMVFAHCERYGNYKGHLKDIVVYCNCLPPLDKQVDGYLNGLP
uniref:Uncharacterized protein LOC111137251 isoform X2 n=1 Tax=Crassostrea virginica TaxID=6565 RepID=A0A8B8EWF9_CRAVI|nr:uncharacterized protein LOC111137251 isoform X2 [Crassostrea virginica]